MTNEQLFELLMFEERLESVEILSQEEAGYDAIFIRAIMHYPDEDMTVPFIHYAGQNWVFTPSDWQGKLPETVEEIQDIEWRVNDTETEGIIFDGLPMLAPWAPDYNETSETARTAVGRMIREARTKAGMTVRELADKAGLSHSHIVRIEAGRYNVTIDTLEKLCNALGLHIELILDHNKLKMKQ